MNRVMISSLVSFLNLMTANPSMANIPALSALVPALQKYKTEQNSKGCNCKKTSTLRDYKPIYDTLMANMSTFDRNQLKSILKADQLCYYVVNANHVLEMKCF